MRIQLDGLRKRFGRFEALRGVDLDLPSGSRVALIGPNGSGKSTLTRALLGLLSYQGRALLDGVEAMERARAADGYAASIPQAPPQFRMPAGELVEAVCSLRGSEAAPAWAAAELLGLRRSEAEGKEFRGLSGGMKQKLLIALAVCSGAPLLVMDEPTSSLDAAARDTFFELCSSLPASSTLLLCSHRLEEIRSLVDRVVVLMEGRVAFEGSAASFLAARSRSTIELSCPDPGCAARLRELGFLPGAGGRWRATVRHAEKRELVLLATREFGEDIQDLQIHDLERLELSEGKEGER